MGQESRIQNPEEKTRTSFSFLLAPGSWLLATDHGLLATDKAPYYLCLTAKHKPIRFGAI